MLAHHGVSVPRIHAIGVLLDLLPPNVPRPEQAEKVAGLTVYAVISRYPGDVEEIAPEEHRAAVALAQTVVAWASDAVKLA